MPNPYTQRIFGCYEEDSADERNLYMDLRRALRKTPNTQCQFFLNYRITDFGVDSQYFYVQDYQKEYLQFVMNRCNLPKQDASFLLSLINGASTRANTLRVDAVKMKNGKLVMAIELNRASHYDFDAHETIEDYREFAKSQFNDMVKEIEMRKICEFYVANMDWVENHGPSNEKSMELVRVLHDFTHDL